MGFDYLNSWSLHIVLHVLCKPLIQTTKQPNFQFPKANNGVACTPILSLLFSYVFYVPFKNILFYIELIAKNRSSRGKRNWPSTINTVSAFLTNAPSWERHNVIESAPLSTRPRRPVSLISEEQCEFSYYLPRVVGRNTGIVLEIHFHKFMWIVRAIQICPVLTLQNFLDSKTPVSYVLWCTNLSARAGHYKSGRVRLSIYQRTNDPSGHLVPKWCRIDVDAM